MLIGAAFVAAIVGMQTAGPSFDCGKAASRVEKIICASGELSALDAVLARFYQGALAALNQSACLKSDQRQWLTGSRDRCVDAACLRSAYLRRLGELAALQPGMNLPKDLALPAVPRLRWIIPAAGSSDTPMLASKPFEASGTIGYVLDKGGYVLQAADGTIHTLVPELLIDGDSQIQLGVLKDQKARVIVRGRHAIIGNDQRMFDNRSCVAIYERP